MSNDKHGWKTSDNFSNGYLECCQQAVEDDSVYASFRADQRYRSILEHSGQRMGKETFEIIIKQGEAIIDHMKRYVQNDDIGNPVKYDFSGIMASPTTLKYIRVLGDLIHEFGDLSKLNILELGGGYGGQCRVISEFSKPKSYTLIDLHWPLKLQEKFLSNYDHVNFVETKDITNMNDSFDLFISNYALSELDKKRQAAIYDKLIRHISYAYMICNEELYIKARIEKDFHVTRVKDLKNEHPKNFILIMRNKNV